jgi:hypothetical protein
MLKLLVQKINPIIDRISEKIPKPKNKKQKIIFMAVFLFLSSFLLSGMIFVLADLAGYGESGPTAAPNSLDYGLVGHWNFEEGSGQTIYDRSGNGNAGTLGASSSVGTDDPTFGLGHDANGETGTGVNMDGVDDYVNAGNGSSLGINNEITISVWINPSSLKSGVYNPFVAKAGSTLGFALWTYGATNPESYVGNGSAWTGHLTSSTPLSLNQWNHLVVTWSVENNIGIMYLNGIKTGSTTVSAWSNASGVNLSFGRSGAYAGTNTFDGSMDEVRIYNRAISANEVNLLYNGKRPLLELDMDENIGTTVKDSSFGNYDGIVYGTTGTAESGGATTLTDTNKSWTTNEWANETIKIIGGTGLGQTRTVSSNTATAVTVSSAWTTNPDATSVYAVTSKDEWTSGKQGSAIDFDGTDDYVDLGDVFRTSRTTGRSFSFWVYPDSINNGTIFSTGNLWNTKAGFSEFMLTNLGVLVSYDFNISPYQYTFPTMADVGQWNHFILTIDVSNSTNTVLKLYKDGKFMSSMNQERVASGGNYETFLLGARTSGAADDKIYPFDGKIDKFKIYNYTLTDDEASTDYNDSLSAHLGEGNQDLSYGLVGHWNFEEGSGQTAYDRSGNENNATLGASSAVGVDDPVFVAGHDSTGDNGTGLKFDGIDDYTDAGSTGNLSAFSISAWVYYDGLNTIWKGIVDQCRGFSSNGGFSLSVGDGSDPNKVVLMLADGSAPSPHFTTTDDLPLNQWVHIIAVWDGTTSASSMKIYFNSVRQSGTDENFGTNLAAATLSTRIGGSNATFPGSIDEVRIYNRALSEDEIRMLYNQKKPLLDLKMDEGSGYVAHDSSFGNYDGTVYGTNGTAESGGATTLTDTNKSWTTDEWSGETISIIYGTGLGQTRTVSSNTATAVTVSSAWTTNPDATSVYQITSKDEWSEGKNATAINFDGDDYVDLGDVLDMGKNDVTISAWIKTSSTGDQYWLSKSKAASQNYRYAVGVQTGKARIFMQGNGGTDVAFKGNINVADNNWHFVSYLFDRDGNASIYVDGIYDAGASISSWNGVDMNSDNPFRVGTYTTADNSGLYGPFYGLVDDVTVYGYIRTQNEILADYNASKSVKLGAGNQDLSYGLVGYWNFEEGAGQTVYDSSGSGNNGILGMSSSIGSDEPIFNGGHDSSGDTGVGLGFDGVNDFVNLGNNSSLNNSVYTVAAWIKNPGVSGYDYIYESTYSGSGVSDQISFRLCSGSDDGRLYLRHGNDTSMATLTSDYRLDDGLWHFVVGSFDGSAMKLYDNGSLIESVTTSIIPRPNNRNRVIGSYQGSVHFWVGSIDEVRVYNRAISDDEVRMLYNQKKPILEMKFDEGSGTVAYDESFNNNDGTITGATWTEGKFGNALSFDGSGDYVDSGNNSVFDVTNQATFSAWVKASNISTDRDIIGKQDSYLFRFSAVSPGKLQLILKSGSNWNFSNLSFNRMDDGAWHYVAGVYDGAKMSIYVDGGIGATDTTFSSNIAVTTNNVFVGARSTSLEYFSGSIDEARVYNYARSAEEIRTDYNNGLATHLR